MAAETPGYYYDDIGDTNEVTDPRSRKKFQGRDQIYRGLMTEKGLNHTIECIEAMKDVLGDEVGLALDVGPGVSVPDALRLAKAVEKFNVMWLEDMITGDYTPYVLSDLYSQVTPYTTTPIHTGEQIYLRQNFKDLIENTEYSISIYPLFSIFDDITQTKKVVTGSSKEGGNIISDKIISTLFLKCSFI